jgi:16S rRNA (guanine(1405)-N(7))-methyltransferase
MTKPTNEIVDNILRSPKYKSIYPPTIERVVENVSKRYPEKEVEKIARQKLHQIWGAYFDRPNFSRITKKVQERFKEGDKAEDILKDLLLMQSSTRERLEHLDAFYQRTFEITGVPSSIVEYGCGINPLTYTWIAKAVTTFQHSNPSTLQPRYIGTDVDQELMDLINTVIGLQGLSERVTVQLGDVLTDEPIEAEMMFLLKVAPLLERQQEGSTRLILQNQPSKWMVVSYPTKSLSGKAKGMKEHYEREFEKVVNLPGWKVTRLEFESELVFVVNKG